MLPDPRVATRGESVAPRYVALLDDYERVMVAGLMEQTMAILAPDPVSGDDDGFAHMMAAMGMPDTDPGPDRVEPSAADRDPALRRLLPRAHVGDDAVAAEFRRLTEPGLRQRKTANLQISMTALLPDGSPFDEEGVPSPEPTPLDLDTAGAHAFVMALTDVRLLLGERLGIRTEADVDLLDAAAEAADDEDPLAHAMAWYDFLAWLQETLAEALLGPAAGPEVAAD